MTRVRRPVSARRSRESRLSPPESRDYDFGDDFRFGLEVIVDGLQRALDDA